MKTKFVIELEWSHTDEKAALAATNAFVGWLLEHVGEFPGEIVETTCHAPCISRPEKMQYRIRVGDVSEALWNAVNAEIDLQWSNLLPEMDERHIIVAVQDGDDPPASPAHCYPPEK